MGILQVDPRGQIANWAVPNQPILGVGGAMYLVAGAKKVIGATTLFEKDSSSKIVEELTYPISGNRAIDMLVTDYAVLSFGEEGIVVDEILMEMSLDELSQQIGIPLKRRELIE